MINRHCGSDCEYLVHVLAAYPHSLIVGANTYGVAQFTQPRYFVLPKTKIPFRLARGMSDMYGDMRSVDGYGLDVDVLLVEEKDYTEESMIKLASSP